MRARLEELETAALVDSLAAGWGFDAAAVDYAPLGGGSYHWIVTDAAGRRAFATVDDLDRKPWLGETRESALDGLRRAFDTARALRDTGLEFVVAPIPGSCGETVRRVGARHAIALFPFVEGQPGVFGRYEPAARAAVVKLVVELHRATPAVASLAGRFDLELPGRRALESALGMLDRPWSGGPFSEPARHALADRATEVHELLDLADRLAADVAARSTDWVVTHGEPHAGNVLRTEDGYVLVDWDTVAVGPPERDLWMLVDDDAGAAAVYAAATGREPDPVVLDFFRLRWDLDDLASFTGVLRSQHRRDPDTSKAYEGLKICAAIRDRWASLLT